jgi:predicted small lipoprotein YifL
MKKVLALAVLLALAGCGEKKAQSAPMADTASTMHDTSTMQQAPADTTMARDSAHQ